MRLSRQVYKLSLLDPKIEFFTIISWILFFPLKDSHLYFFIFAVLIVIFSFRNIIFMKNLSLSPFSYFLAAFNLILMFSMFFANNQFKSILMISDIFLISLYFILYFFNKNNEDEYFQLLVYLISIISFAKIINYIFVLIDKKNIFFSNSILQGVVSGIAVLILIYYLLKKFSWRFFGLLVLNCAGVFVSESKGAFIGIVIFSFLMVLLKKKKLIPLIIVLTLLTFIFPNPIKEMFVFSLKKDPYATNRIDIWKMSINIFKDNFPFGVGPDNFSEVSKKYNFKQTRGPANYFKLPRHPHNDYFKLLTETGIAGLIFLLLFSCILIKKIFSSSLFNLSKLLILYLLFHAFGFNIIFNNFFFFIFVFLLKNLFEEQLTYKSFMLNSKAYFIFLLVFALIVGYLLPFLSYNVVKKANESQDIVTRFNLLSKSGYLNPMDPNIPYLKASLLCNYFKETSNLESFYSALECLKKAQRLNRYLIKAYLLESDLFNNLLKKNLFYSALYEEIIAPLTKAEEYAPLDPFIKLRKAEVYLRFKKLQLAMQQALKALELEPDYVSALYFLQKNFNYFPDEKTFKKRIDRILNKASKVKPEPGTYLYDLFNIPRKTAITKINKKKYLTYIQNRKNET